MSARQQAHMLPDGRRLHLQDGPIDLIIGADGAPDAIAAAYDAATKRFATLLDELCAELTSLRQAVTRESLPPRGDVARRMFAAARPYADRHFITPMVAVAGAGAEAVLKAMTAAAPLTRAYVNNGGDIALHLADGAQFDIGMVDRPDQPHLFGKLTIRSRDPIRGIATSGRLGRSFSLGIADAVTVLAEDAPTADAAATMIANRVDLPGHPAILRVPANTLQPDSDLGSQRVTRSVGALTPAEIDRALTRGTRYAEDLLETGRIHAAAFHLAGQTRFVQATPNLLAPIHRNKEVDIHAAS
jgi:ApbE superfamily uncharacterized protein (UPF0280 family)